MKVREYRAALNTLAQLMEQVDKLSTEIETYERENFIFNKPTPAEAIKFRMEQGGHTQTELAKLLGSRTTASALLLGIRKPSKRTAMLIHKAWGVPLSSLLQG